MFPFEVDQDQVVKRKRVGVRVEIG